MATRYWLGLGTATAQKNTFTIGGTLEAGDQLIITMTAENLSTYAFTYEAASSDKAAEAILMAAAWNLSTNALCTPITATAVGDTIELLADTEGVPFYAAASTTESGGGAADDQTFTMAATTPNAGPNDTADTNNWSDATIPVTNDTVIVDGRTTESILYGMNMTGVDLTKVHVMPSYTGSIGAEGSPLIIECSGNFIIQGSGDYYIQCGNDAADADIALLVIDAAVDSVIGLSSQKNASAGNVAIFTAIVAQTGILTLYGDADKTTTNAQAGTAFGTLYVASSERETDISVIVGDGCTDLKNAVAGTIYLGRGTLACYSAAALIHVNAGTFTVGGSDYVMDEDDDNIAAVIQFGGTFDWQPSNGAGLASPSPAIASYQHFGGRLTAENMPATQTTVPTITSYIQGTGAEIDTDNGLANVAITAWLRTGGEITLSAGQFVLGA